MNIKRRTINIFKDPIIWPILALAIILVINFFAIPGFFFIEIKNGRFYGSLIDILNRGTPLIIIALGMTLVIAKEGIDISVGAVLAIAGASAIYMLDYFSVFVAIIFALLIGLVCGLWNGALVAIFDIQPMVGTLILMTIGRGIAQLITNGQVTTTNNEVYAIIGKGYFLGFPVPLFIAIFILAILIYLKKRTSLGLFLEAVGANKRASEFAGIQPKLIYFIVYGICSLCAAIAGLIISSNLNSADANNAGLWIELDAILAVVIGGTSMRGGRFYLVGTVVGALFIQTISTTIYSTGIPPQTIMVIKAIVVIIVCLMQSEQFRAMFQFRKAAVVKSNRKKAVEL
ncbi:ABC transporter permease [Bacillus sp. FSL K6-3431]|uniref:ABC transporter permease n=1 Tax=Bacillus sp. FSL K6-3431 TaxID=2921500 RepID=UPI0030F5ED75